MEIITNNVPRHLVDGYELTDRERAEFDYIDDIDRAHGRFIRYKGELIDVYEYVVIPAAADYIGGMYGWHGYRSDSYFSGTVIKYTDDYESVIVGRYLC